MLSKLFLQTVKLNKTYPKIFEKMLVLEQISAGSENNQLASQQKVNPNISTQRNKDISRSEVFLEKDLNDIRSFRFLKNLELSDIKEINLQADHDDAIFSLEDNQFNIDSVYLNEEANTIKFIDKDGEQFDFQFLKDPLKNSLLVRKFSRNIDELIARNIFLSMGKAPDDLKTDSWLNENKLIHLHATNYYELSETKLNFGSGNQNLSCNGIKPAGGSSLLITAMSLGRDYEIKISAEELKFTNIKSRSSLSFPPELCKPILEMMGRLLIISKEFDV